MLPKDIQSLVSVCKLQPENEAVFVTLLTVLENASDSAIISEAMASLPHEKLKAHAVLSQRAYHLLIAADDKELAHRWAPQSMSSQETENDAPLTNVIPLNDPGKSISSIAIERPLSKTGVTMDDVAGLHALKKQIHRKIIRPFENPSLHKHFKRRAGGGVLMYGPPGCGKTMIAKAVATECKATFFGVSAGDILDKYVGVAEKRIGQLFEDARMARPAVLLFDEFEALGQRRNYSGTHGESTTISTLLQEMDGAAQDNEGILFLGATNVPWSIDAAFKRPGRFDRTLFVPPPDQIARRYLLKRILKDKPVSDDLHLEPLLKRTSGFSGADIEALVESATDFAIDESDNIESLTPISNRHFESAFGEIKSSVGEWLGIAKGFAEHANHGNQYSDLVAFLKKHT